MSKSVDQLPETEKLEPVLFCVTHQARVTVSALPGIKIGDILFAENATGRTRCSKATTTGPNTCRFIEPEQI